MSNLPRAPPGFYDLPSVSCGLHIVLPVIILLRVVSSRNESLFRPNQSPMELRRAPWNQVRLYLRAVMVGFDGL